MKNPEPAFALRPHSVEGTAGPTEWHRCLRLLDDLAAELRGSLRHPEQIPTRHSAARS